MDIFITWSGARSLALAEALKKWLPQIANAFKPWVSPDDIRKGARWIPEIAATLQTAKAGIICLTPSNLTAPWVLFEAGALSKTPYVCTLLLGLKHADLTLPLSQFQATATTKDEMLKLVKDLNAGLEQEARPPDQLSDAFETWWPRLETEIQNLPADNPPKDPQRSQQDMLEELLDLTRAQHNDMRLGLILSLLADVAREDRFTATAHIPRSLPYGRDEMASALRWALGDARLKTKAAEPKEKTKEDGREKPE